MSLSPNHLFQIIRSSKSFTIHIYMFGVRSEDSMVYPIEELSSVLRAQVPVHFTELATIRTTCKGVRDNSDYKNEL